MVLLDNGKIIFIKRVEMRSGWTIGVPMGCEVCTNPNVSEGAAEPSAADDLIIVKPKPNKPINFAKLMEEPILFKLQCKMSHAEFEEFVDTHPKMKWIEDKQIDGLKVMHSPGTVMIPWTTYYVFVSTPAEVTRWTLSINTVAKIVERDEFVKQFLANIDPIGGVDSALVSESISPVEQESSQASATPKPLVSAASPNRARDLLVQQGIMHHERPIYCDSITSIKDIKKSTSFCYEDYAQYFFDIINPVLAALCRKYKVKVRTNCALVQSESQDAEWTNGDRFVLGESIDNETVRRIPNGGSLTEWFVDMAIRTGIANETALEQILANKPTIDGNTYCYLIEYHYYTEDDYFSKVFIEKRSKNEVRQYGFDEDSLGTYIERLKKNNAAQLSQDQTILSAYNDIAYPLSEMMREGEASINIGFVDDYYAGDYMERFLSPTTLGFPIVSDEMVRSPYNRRMFRAIMLADTGKNVVCTTPIVMFPMMNSPFAPVASLEGQVIAFYGKLSQTASSLEVAIKACGCRRIRDFSSKLTVVVIGKTLATNFLDHTDILLNALAEAYCGYNISVMTEDELTSRII